MNLIARIIICVLCIVPLSIIVLLVRSGLERGVRICLEFYLVIYFLTFFVGGIILYITDFEIIEYYYSGSMWIPELRRFEPTYLALVFLPIVVPTLIAGFISRRIAAPILGHESRPIEIWNVCVVAFLFGAMAILGLFRTGLSSSVFRMLRGGASLVDFYAQRHEVMDSISMWGAGFVYSSLPLLAMISWIGAWSTRLWSWRVLAFLITVVSIGANLFFVQAGPLFVMALITAFLRVVYLDRPVVALKSAMIAIAMLLGLILYHRIKMPDSDFSMIGIHFFLRMPVALPYALEAFGPSGGTGTILSDSDSVAHAVGSYVTPEFDGFVAMPLPAHADAYLRFGWIGAIAILVGVGGLIVFLGKLAPSPGSRLDHRGALFVALLPALYYSTQVSPELLFLSSYGVVLSLMPAAHLWLQAKAERFVAATYRSGDGNRGVGIPGNSPLSSSGHDANHHETV